MTFALDKFLRFLPSATFVMAAEYLIGLSHSVICGHLMGADALAAVNLMQPVLAAVAFCALLAGTGTSVLYSVEMGRFEQRRAREILTQGLWTACMLGAFAFAILALFRERAAESFGVSGAVLALVKEYWLWFLPCAILAPVEFLLTSACYSDGDGRICTLAYVGRLAGNCVISYVLALKYGIGGCAAGAAAGHIIAAGVLCLHFRKKTNSLGFVRHFSLADSFRICKCSMGDSSDKLCQAALFLALNLFCVAQFGPDVLPVVSVVIVVLGLSEVFDGVAKAMQPLASVYIGEGSDRLVKRILRYAEAVSGMEGACLAALLCAFPSLVLRLVGLDEPGLVERAALAVRIVSLGLVGTALVSLFNSYWTFKSRETLACSLTLVSMFFAPLALFVPLGCAFGEVGVWAALALAPYVSAGALSAFVAWKWGVRALPAFLDRAKMKATRVYDIVLGPDSICALSEKVGKFLAARRGIGERKASLTALLLEEALMVVMDRNAKRRIRAEVSLWFGGDSLQLTVRDDGVIFNLTDADTKISSLRSFMVSNLMLILPARRNMTTTGFNRNAFKI